MNPVNLGGGVIAGGCPDRPWCIGHGPFGSIQLYSLGGADVVRELFVRDVHDARRRVRACRRAMESGPLRINVSVSREGAEGLCHEERATVYGWRAALVAVRAMREEFRPGDRYYQRRWLCTLVSDARLDAVLWPDD